MDTEKAILYALLIVFVVIVLVLLYRPAPAPAPAPAPTPMPHTTIIRQAAPWWSRDSRLRWPRFPRH